MDSKIAVMSEIDLSQLSILAVKGVNISSYCKETLPDGEKALVYYVLKWGVRTFGLALGGTRQEFPYDKVVTTVDPSIAKGFNFFAYLYGVKSQTLCNLVLENNPW